MSKKQFEISIDHAMMAGAKQAFDKCLQMAVARAIGTGSDEGSAALKISFTIMTTVDEATGELRRMPIWKYKAGLKNGVWHDAVLDPPGAADVLDGWQHVLIVKENKSGERVICFGAFLAGDYDPVTHRYNGQWTTNNGKGKVLYWMPLPKIPEE